MGELEKMMMKYDADGTGTFSVAEVKAIVKDLEVSKKQANAFAKLSAGLTLSFLVLAAAMLVMGLMANEVSKENHTAGDTLVSPTEYLTSELPLPLSASPVSPPADSAAARRPTVSTSASSSRPPGSRRAKPSRP